MKTEILKIGEKYKYKELCEILNEKELLGNSRKAQFKEWERYFKWSNPNSRTYLIEEIYDFPKDKIDGRKNNGGARKGAGNPGKLNDEFNYLLNYFLRCEYNKNKYEMNNPYWDSTYFTKGNIAVFFGLRKDEYKYAQYDENIDKIKYLEFNRMITRKIDSWLINKIKRKSEESSDIQYGEGIIAIKINGDMLFDDSLLSRYYEYQYQYFEKNNYHSYNDVIINAKWSNMKEYINSCFSGYIRVDKFKKIVFDHKKLKEYDIDKCKKYQKQFNDRLIDELYKYFLKHEKDKYNKRHEYLEWEMKNYIDLYYYIYELNRNLSPDNPKEDEYYIDMENEYNTDFNEEEVMKPYKYIIDNYVRIS